MENRMMVTEISFEEYCNITKNTIVYQRGFFLDLNKEKVDEIKYLKINKGESPRFALNLGIRGCEALCPFSSPCGYPISLKNSLAIHYFDEALEALDFYCEQFSIRTLTFILPPIFYNREEISIWINSLYRHGYSIKNIDINYAFRLADVYTDEYSKIIQHNARKNLRIALNSNLELIRCESKEEDVLAYNIIAENRRSKGYPLRMTCQQVLSTIEYVDHDIFIVRKDKENVAASLVYRITPNIAQVIYWGDRPGFSELKSINYLSYSLIQYYGQLGYEYLDIGISTVDSIPNYGLCEFKESIGCERDLKFSFVKIMGA